VKNDVDCGICSYCITKKQAKDNTSLASAIVTLLQSENLNSRDIQNRTKNNSEEVIAVLQYLLETTQFWLNQITNTKS
jgi:ATP-dependent DNA helicase RecQ